MASLPVSKGLKVLSPECTGCLDCIAVCPVGDALEVRTVGRRKIRGLGFAALLVAIFVVGYAGARATGSWANDISDREYMERIPELNSPEYGHPGT
jgi:ferredoxin